MSRIPWITSKQFTVDLFPAWSKTSGDKEWSLGSVTIDVSAVTARLEALILELNADQWEIKLVVPMDKSLTFHEHQKVVRAPARKDQESVVSAFGLGWAAPTTAAFIVLAQRTEWLTDAEYQSRINERNERIAQDDARKNRLAILEHNASINTKITASQQRLSALRAQDVTSKKVGIMRTERFIFDGQEFATRGEAANARSALIEELEGALVDLPKLLKPVPPG